MGKQFFQKKFLPFALTAAMLLPAVPAMAATNDLQGHWAEPTITEWQKKGLIQGYEDGSFKPNSSITRAEFIVLTNNAKGFTEEAKISFLDVKDGDWFYSAVAKAVAANYVKGYEDGTFHPNQTITRAEAAVILANITGLDANAAGADSFTDAAQIPAWAKGSIGAAAAAGYMSGYPDGSFGASAPITRAEAVSSLNRVLGAAETAKEDFIITEPGTVVKDKVITGDLIIEESVGDGDVYLENVTVEGDTFVKGGGSHSIYAKNSNFGGTVYAQKNNVHFGISGSTQIKDMQLNQPSSITFDKDFSGSLKNLSIPEGAQAGNYSIESKDKNSTPVENMNVDAKAKLTLDANISSMTVGEKAEDSSIIVEKDAQVDDMKIKSKTEISGEGTIDNMDVGANGVIIDKALTVEETTTSNSAETPLVKPITTPYYGGGSSSSGGGSSRPSKPTVTITPYIINLQNTTNAYFTLDNASVTLDDLFISVTKDGSTLTKDTDYKINFSGQMIEIEFQSLLAKDAEYEVTIEASSVGASKYSIEKTTTTLATPKTLQWSATTSGAESIVPNAAIPEDGAKVTFTVTGATFNSMSTNIGAKLQANTPESSESIIINSLNIAPTIGGNTITVDLVGQSLSVGTYTVTLTVDKSLLNLNVPYVADEISTATTTFTVTEKLVAMGEPTSKFTEITSGATLPTGSDVLSITFPMTGVKSFAETGENAYDVTITPTGSDIATLIGLTTNSMGGKDAYVELRGTAPTVATDTEYTVTLKIPKAGITVVPGYTFPESTTADLTKTFTFTVKPAPTTTPIRVQSTTYDTVEITAGAAIPESTTLTLNITGASALTTSGIQVIAFQNGNSVEISNTGVFTPNTTGGTLVLTLSGTAPTISDTGLSSGSNGLKVVIPKEAFTPMDGYTLPSKNITIQDFKFVLNPATTPTGE